MYQDSFHFFDASGAGFPLDNFTVVLVLFGVFFIAVYVYRMKHGSKRHISEEAQIKAETAKKVIVIKDPYAKAESVAENPVAMPSVDAVESAGKDESATAPGTTKQKALFSQFLPQPAPKEEKPSSAFKFFVPAGAEDDEAYIWE